MEKNVNSGFKLARFCRSCNGGAGILAGLTQRPKPYPKSVHHKKLKSIGLLK